MYRIHPSTILRELFARKPYQGADPCAARFLFIGLDANYAASIESGPIFEALVDYHRDGPAFWRRHGVHHPFLLPHYRGDGRRYHRNFARIGFEPRHAEQVSFLELLHVPTVGRNSLALEDLDGEHLATLRRAIFHGSAQFVFVSAGVLRLMVATGMFGELNGARRARGALSVLFEDDRRTVFLHLHFSNYGKFEQPLQAQAREIGGLVGAA
ncbi:MAG: hypothetical protein WDA10_05710 [Porticoccaceae bacterium]|nr:hypothetical protein [Porticoccaceae bacterium]HLS99112.1 hypothetical protein [Porticoccaceae bacterium]